MSKKIENVKEIVKVEEKKKGWRIKEYYLNMEIFKSVSTEKCPNQVKIILKEMSERFNKIESAGQGKIIINSAIENSSLKTVIDPPVLFAYYRKYMEEFGLTLK